MNYLKKNSKKIFKEQFGILEPSAVCVGNCKVIDDEPLLQMTNHRIGVLCERDVRLVRAWTVHITGSVPQLYTPFVQKPTRLVGVFNHGSFGARKEINQNLTRLKKKQRRSTSLQCSNLSIKLHD